MGCGPGTPANLCGPSYGGGGKFFYFREIWKKLKEKYGAYDPDDQIRMNQHLLEEYAKERMRIEEEERRKKEEELIKLKEKQRLDALNQQKNKQIPVKKQETLPSSPKYEEKIVKPNKKSYNEGNTIQWRRGEPISLKGKGKVYQGFNLEDGKTIAIKSENLSSNPELAQKEMESYQKDTKIFKELNHNNIIKCLQADISESEKQVDILMEYFPAGSLKNLLEKYGGLNEILIKAMTRQVLEALSYAHSKGIVHKNLKCSNMMMDNDGNVKLSDFGYSNTIMKDLNGNLILKGNPNWTSPEALKTGDFIPPSDIWSVGCTAIEMLNGKEPWSELNLNEQDLSKKIKENNLRPSCPKTSPELQKFISKCLNANPNERLSASELLQDPFFLRKENDKSEEEALKMLSEYLKNGFPPGFNFEKMVQTVRDRCLLKSPKAHEIKKEAKKQIKKAVKSPRSPRKVNKKEDDDLRNIKKKIGDSEL